MRKHRLAPRLFLYSKDDAKIHRWKRAFTLAKVSCVESSLGAVMQVLVSDNDRRALKVQGSPATIDLSRA